MRATCDLLTNAIILTMDQRFTMYPSSAVAIACDSIVAVGPDAQAYEAWPMPRAEDSAVHHSL